MGKIVMVTGGARSGKSTFAETKVAEVGDKIAYIATGIAFDKGMEDRIKKHQAQRPGEWTTFEQATDVYKIINDVSKNHDTVLLDCMTVMVSNEMLGDFSIDWDHIPMEDVNMLERQIHDKVDMLLENIKDSDLTVFVVTNELGMGIVPEYRLSRLYRDVAGRINQKLSASADEVYFVVSGIPMKIK